MTLPSLPKVSLPKGPKALGLTALALGLVALGVGAWRHARPPLPAEYQTLQAVVGRLAAHNALGTSPIGLTINNGSYAATLAQMRGYCKEAACDFYAQLNPYMSYTLGDIGAWSTSSGTIEVPRTAFRIYGRHTGWLACTVAHEIAHIQRNQIFLASYYASNTIRSAPEKKKEELNYAKSR